MVHNGHDFCSPLVEVPVEGILGLAFPAMAAHGARQGKGRANVG